MNVLVTGITGLLGSQIAKSCYEAGHKVYGLHRCNPDSIKLNFPIILRNFNLVDRHINPGLLEDIDAVIHSAADTSMGQGHNLQQDVINILAVKRLTDLCIKQKVRRFIFVSTANTFEPGSKYVRLNPGPYNFNYANSKILAEKVVQRAVKKGLNAIILNPTFMLGPAPLGTSSNKLIQYALNKKILFYPPGGKNFIDVRDVAEAAVVSLNEGQIGRNYILAHKNLSYKNLFKRIAEKYNTNAVVIPIPKRLLIFVGFIGSVVEKIFGKPSELNQLTAKALSTNYFYNDKMTRKLLSRRLYKLEDTIRDFQRLA